MQQETDALWAKKNAKLKAIDCMLDFPKSSSCRMFPFFDRQSVSRIERRKLQPPAHQQARFQQVLEYRTVHSLQYCSLQGCQTVNL